MRRPRLFANWVQHTSATGGTGTLTLTAVTGSPGWADAFGTGSRYVSYDIVEYTNSTRTVVSQAETGIGDFNGSTLILTRTKILATWTGGVYDDIAPTALTFGTTAANIRVRCAPTAAHDQLSMQWVQRSLGDVVGIASLHLSVNAVALAMVANSEYYVPFLWKTSAEVDFFCVYISAATAGGSGIKGGIYEVGSDGLPGGRLLDATASGVIANTATGQHGVTVSHWLPRGWYYVGLLCAGTTSLRSHSSGWPSPAGTTSGNINSRFINASGSFATGLPATGPSSASLTAATNTTYAAYLRPRL